MAKKRKRNGGTFNTVTSCISTTMVLVLLGTVVLFVTVAAGFGKSVRENFTVEVLLDDSIPARDLAALKTDLARRPYVRQVNYISKEQGTKELVQDMNADPREFLGYSPVPAEYELFLRAEYANRDSLSRYLPELKAHRYVTDVVCPLDLMDSLNEVLRVAGLVLLSLAVLLAFVSFSLINNTLRMSIYARRFTIRTMKLVGARWSFIRRPFMVRAFWIGFVSATLASGLLAAGLWALVRVNANTQFEVDVPLVAAATFGAVYACGLLLTLLCAFFSVNRHLRMSADEVYLK